MAQGHTTIYTHSIPDRSTITDIHISAFVNTYNTQPWFINTLDLIVKFLNKDASSSVAENTKWMIPAMSPLVSTARNKDDRLQQIVAILYLGPAPDDDDHLHFTYPATHSLSPNGSLAMPVGDLLVIPPEFTRGRAPSPPGSGNMYIDPTRPAVTVTAPNQQSTTVVPPTGTMDSPVPQRDVTEFVSYLTQKGISMATFNASPDPIKVEAINTFCNGDVVFKLQVMQHVFNTSPPSSSSTAPPPQQAPVVNVQLDPTKLGMEPGFHSGISHTKKQDINDPRNPWPPHVYEDFLREPAYATITTSSTNREKDLNCFLRAGRILAYSLIDSHDNDALDTLMGIQTRIAEKLAIPLVGPHQASHMTQRQNFARHFYTGGLSFQKHDKNNQGNKHSNPTRGNHHKPDNKVNYYSRDTKWPQDAPLPSPWSRRGHQG